MGFRASRRARAWAVLLAGLVVLGLAAWLSVRRTGDPAVDPTGDPAGGSTSAAAAGPTADSGAQTGWLVRWALDGDTLDLERDGQATRLRLLNIDAPERARPDRAAQCLADAATARLTELAPRGSALTVTLTGHDRYGRALGEAWLPDGRMLGAEVARSGLAAPVTIGGQDRFRTAIDAARDEAAAAGRGLHDPAIDCTVPARVAAIEGRAHGIPSSDAPARGALRTEAEALLVELTDARPHPGVAVLPAATRERLAARVHLVVTALG